MSSFKLPSVSKEQIEHLGNRLEADIIARLARSRMMLVIARGTAFQFRGGRHDVRHIGEKLRVRYVVQGAVQIQGRRMCVGFVSSGWASPGALVRTIRSTDFLATFPFQRERDVERVEKAFDAMRGELRIRLRSV